MYDDKLKQAALELLYALDNSPENIQKKKEKLANAVAEEELLIMQTLIELSDEHDILLH